MPPRSKAQNRVREVHCRESMHKDAERLALKDLCCILCDLCFEL